MQQYALVGLGVRFPGGCNSPDTFWHALAEGKDCVTRGGSNRWNAEYYTSADKDTPGKAITSSCGLIDFVHEFDNEAFGISKREAECMDPQQKILLEVCLNALEDSGIKYNGSRTGVFVGVGQEEHFSVSTHDKEAIGPYSVTGATLSICSNRISYVFNLHGPSLSVDTACSSSLTAFHIALNSLTNGECDQALVAGVNIVTDPSVMIEFSKLGVLSPEGICRSFDKDANGYVRAEGCGAVVLKPLKAALRDKDHIYCVVLSSAINSDGRRSPSLTMPSGDAQAEVFLNAANRAGVNPKEVFFVEAHATGTKVGDPIEANAIGSVFGGSSRALPLRMGAVKPNVGHMECAAFMAALIKSALVIDRATLLPTINYKNPNPEIKFNEYQLVVQNKLESFDARGKLFAVSSFGFGGSNGCVILQGFASEEKKINEVCSSSSSPLLPSSPLLFLLTGETPSAVEQRISSFRQYFSEENKEKEKENKEARSGDKLSLSISASGTLIRRQAQRYLSVGIGRDPATVNFTEPSPTLQRQPLVWVFAGQGPQHHDMGRQLYARFPVFKQSIDTCDKVFAAASGYSLLKDIGLFGPERGPDPNAVYQLKHTLPALVFLQLALVDLWTSFGIRPDAVVGHSFGEMAATYAAGACSKEKLVELAYHRAQLLTRLEGKGAMIALGCGASVVEPFLAVKEGQSPSLWIAAYNSPEAVTVGGKVESVNELAKVCKEKGIFNRVLKINSAFHTPIMSSLREEAISLFSSCLSSSQSYKPKLPFLSTVSGDWQEKEFEAGYMWSNIEQPVRFQQGVEKITQRFGSDCVFMELSAHPVLTAYIKQSGGKNTISVLHREQPEENTTLQALATLASYNCPIDSTSLLGNYAPLPSSFLPYPLKRVFLHREDKDHFIDRTVPEWKPLLGRPQPHPEKETFHNKVSVPAYPWMSDHVVQDAVVFPGAGYVEIAMEVVGNRNISDITIHNAMVLLDKESRHVRTTISQLDEANVRINVYSKSDAWEKLPWTLHSTATACKNSPETRADTQMTDWHKEILMHIDSPSTVTTESGTNYSFAKKECYERFKSVGLCYGPVFQGIQQISQTGQDCGYAYIDTTETGGNDKFSLHPAILDACFQVLLGCMKSLNTAYVPVHIEKIDWSELREMPKRLLVLSRSVKQQTQDSESQQVRGDIVILDAETRKRIGYVQGMKATPLSVKESAEQSNYEVAWQPWALRLSPFSPSLPAQLTLTDVEVVRTHTKCFDFACAAYIARALGELPPKFEENLPSHRQRYLTWCKKLVACTPQCSEPASISRVGVITQIPELQLEAEAVVRVGENLTELLKNPQSVQAVLFKDDLLERVYKRSLTFAPYVKALSDILTRLVAANTDRVIRILEVGAGTGGLSHTVIHSLAELKKQFPELQLKYVFSDISQKFLKDAQSCFTDFPWVDYTIFNLESDVESQSLPSHSFDFVLAYDALHVAKDLTVCLEHVRELLVPSGMLLAIEPTLPPVWMDMLFGLFKEWWGFADPGNRTARCTLTRPQWREVLQRHEFENVRLICEMHGEEEKAEFCHSLVIAHTCAPKTLATQEEQGQGESKPSNSIVFDCMSAETLLVKVQALLNDKKEEKKEEKKDEAVSESESKDIWILTQGAERVLENDDLNPDQATAIGFARVFSSEYLTRNIRIVDFPMSLSAAEKSKWMQRLETMATKKMIQDREIAIRGNEIWVPKFKPAQASQSVSTFRAYESERDSLFYQLDIESKGQLNTLSYKEVAFPTLEDDEILVTVHATALNFKDLMLALGMITVPSKFSKLNLGLEFSGIVKETGKNVCHVSVGQEVFGVGRNCLASHVVTHRDFVMPKPAHLTHTEAASMPIIFATTYAALFEKARVCAGETVLVHSAAGGIGQACIQLSQHVGAGVIATVGGAEKREYLREKYGVQNFANSHDTKTWGKEVREITQNKGVDVVVNSLKGDAIAEGLKSLKLGGRFVEIGKVDILANSSLGLAPFLRDLSFHSVQLDIVMEENTQLMHKYLSQVAELANKRIIKPIVDRVFTVSDTENAFRYMMSGKHKGKIVVQILPSTLTFQQQEQAAVSSPSVSLPGAQKHADVPLYVKPLLFRDDCLYVISGGLGALAWEMVKWMVGEGATRFLLLSRSARLSHTQREELAQLQGKGARVMIEPVDVSVREKVHAVYEKARKEGLLQKHAAVLHMAMVLRDAPLRKMTPSDMQMAMRCKIEGARNLVEYFAPKPSSSSASPSATVLDFALLFSSISASFGNPDQCNYAAANSFLDTYAFHLRKQGYENVKVLNLSAVEDVGVLAENYRLRQMTQLRGFQGGLTSKAMIQNVRSLLLSRPSTVQWIYGNFDWKALTEMFPTLTAKSDHLIDYRAKFRDEAGAMDVGAGGASVQSLTLFMAKIFSLDAKTMDPATPLTQYGLDSLLAVELSAGLKKTFNIKVTQMELLGGLSIEKILARAH